MGDILKFVATACLILFILVFAIPLLWLVIKLFSWLFGGLVFLMGDALLVLLIVVGVVMLFKWAAS